MKINYPSHYFFLFVLLIQCTGSVTDPSEVRQLTDVEKQVVSSSEEFGFKLFKKVNEFEGAKNIFISPLSVSMALGMTLNGAENETYTAMQSTLGFGSLSKKEINEGYKSLIDLLTQIDPKVIFQIANSIWYKDNMKFEKTFIDVNKEYFNAEIEGLDFSDPISVDIINNWVNTNTNGKIDKILNAIPPQAIMYLINAIYFNGTWKYEFDKEQTQDAMFTSESGEEGTCKLMTQSNKFMYYGNEDLQAIDLPYGDGHFSMTILLPSFDKSTSDIINHMSSESFNDLLVKLEEQEGTVQLPRFKLEYEYLLNDVLTALDMGVAFSENADFTNLYKPGGVFISRVKHKTFVQVDEEGTEAAAVTVVEIGYTSEPQGFAMRIDRPFVFMIRENNSGSILFIGRIEKT